MYRIYIYTCIHIHDNVGVFNYMHITQPSACRPEEKKLENASDELTIWINLVRFNDHPHHRFTY